MGYVYKRNSKGYYEKVWVDENEDVAPTKFEADSTGTTYTYNKESKTFNEKPTEATVNIEQPKKKEKEEKPSFGTWLGTNLAYAPTQFNKGLVNTLQWLNPMKNDEDFFFTKLLDWYETDVVNEAEKERSEVNEASGKLGKFVGETVIGGTVSALPQAMLAYASGGASATAGVTADLVETNLQRAVGKSITTMAKNPSFWMSFSTTAGSTYEDAINSGASEIEANATAIINGLLGSVVEIGGGIEEIPNIRGGIREWVHSALEEGREEVIQGVIEGLTSKAVYDKDKEWASIENTEAVVSLGRAIEEFVSGATVGGVMSAGGSVYNNFQEAKAEGLSDNEARIHEKLMDDAMAEAVEEKGTDLTRSERNKIKKQVLQQVKEGDVSLDTIREVLGEGVDISNDRYLQEALNQNYQRSQDFQYEKTGNANVDAVYNSAKGSGMNNTRKTKNYVDFVAKVSKETGLKIRFTTTDQITNMGKSKFVEDKNGNQLYTDGKGNTYWYNQKTDTFMDNHYNTVNIDKNSVSNYLRTNGFVDTDGTIYLNTQSEGALETVLGHEITHTLEGSKEFKALQDMVLKYAKTKNAYEPMLAQVRENYSGIEDSEAVNEVTAEMIGRVLFNNDDFISNLSAEQPNLLVKVYNEIKHMVKMATAGSKEARQLEKIKHRFEKAYQETYGKNISEHKLAPLLPQGDGKMKYKLVGKEGDIEVYRSSQETKDMDFKEKKKALATMLRTELKGKQIKFTVNGETHTAVMDKMSANKGVYGDKKSSPGGYGAKLNIGVEGDYLTLLENSLYSNSAVEQGKTTASGIHDKTKQWNYFKKTIKSDGKYYDVLINVRDTGDGQFVYDVTLTDNRKIKYDKKAPLKDKVQKARYSVSSVNIPKITANPFEQSDKFDSQSRMVEDAWKETLNNKVFDGFEFKYGNGNIGTITRSLRDDNMLQLTTYKSDGTPLGHREYKISEIGSGGATDIINDLPDGIQVTANRPEYTRPTFFLKSAQVLETVKGNKLGANSVASLLRGKGVKAEELKWLDIDSFLEGKKSVTKQELMDYIYANDVKIYEEHNLDSESFYIDGNNNTLSEEEVREQADLKLAEKGITDYEYKVNEFVDPDDETVNVETYAILPNGDVESLGYFIKENPTRWKEYTVDGGSNYREIKYLLADQNRNFSTYSNYSMDVHWGQPGVLAHSRVQDFVDHEGNKVLFVEEIQSDWHNKGHKDGYGVDFRTPKNVELNKLWEQVDALKEQKRDLGGDISLDKSDLSAEDLNSTYSFDDDFYEDDYIDIDAELEDLEYEELTGEAPKTVNPEIAKIDKQIEDLMSEIDRIRTSAPDAPFKDNYQEYVLKSLLRTACEEGYDSIAWTTADMQSQRWSDEYAEGYRIEYDQQIPSFLRKYGKKWGAKLGWTSIGVYNETNVPKIDITNSMRNSVLREGQPKYSVAVDSKGHELNNNQQKFFEKSKAVDEDGNLLVMYHGSDKAGFTRFNPSYSDDGISLFFTDRIPVAQSYSDTKKTMSFPSDNDVTVEDLNKMLDQFKIKQRVEEEDGNFFIVDKKDDYEYESFDNMYDTYEHVMWLLGNTKRTQRVNYECYLNLENPLEIDCEYGYWYDIPFEQQIGGENTKEYKSVEIVRASPYSASVMITDAEDQQIYERFDSHDEAIQYVENKFNKQIADDLKGKLLMGLMDDPLGYVKATYSPVHSKGFTDIYGFKFDPDTKQVISLEPQRYKTRDISKLAKERGYDGVIFRNLIDMGGYDVEEEASTVIIAFNGNQVKSTTNTNPSKYMDDIRYSTSADAKTPNVRPVTDRRRTYTQDVMKDYIAPVKTEAKEITYDNAPMSIDELERNVAKGNIDIPEEANQEYEDSYAPSSEMFGYSRENMRDTYRQQAEYLLEDLKQAVKGERGVNTATGETYGVTRRLAPDLANLVDSGFSYKRLESALEKLIGGTTRKAKIYDALERVIYDRLTEGYSSTMGYDVPADSNFLTSLKQTEMEEAPVDYQAMADQIEIPEENVYEEVDLPIRQDVPTTNNDIKYASPQAPTPVNNVANIVEKEYKKDSLKDRVTRGFGETIKTMVNKGYGVDKLAKDSGNKRLTHLYDKMLSARGEGQYAIGHKQTDNNGKVIGKGVNELWKPVEDAKLMKPFQEYLLHKHNISRWVEGKPVFGMQINDVMSKKAVANYEKMYPQFAQWSREINQYNKNQLQNMVDGGITDARTQQLLDSIYDNYVRIQRDVEKRGYGVISTSNGNIRINSPIQKAKGGNQDIFNLKDSMALQTMEIKSAIRRNQLAVEIKNTLDGQGQLNVVNTPQDPTKPIEYELLSSENGMYSMTAFENGRPIQFEITKDIYDAMNTKKSESDENWDNSLLGKGLQGLQNSYRNLLTNDNPIFALTNMFKDMSDAPFNSKYPARFPINYANAIRHMVSNSDLYQQYQALGGEDNTYFTSQEGFKKESKLDKVNPIKKLRDRTEAINSFTEQIPRMAEFLSTMQETGDVMEAMYNSAEVTTNFKRGGDVAKKINRNFAPFFNASIQGLSKTVRNFTDDGLVRGTLKTAVKGAMFGLAPAMLNHLTYADDEEYKGLSDYVKDSYYLLKTEKGNFIRIPKGRLMAVIGASARRLYEGEGMEGMGSLIGDNVAPNNPFTENLIAPLVQAKNNLSWYGGNIVPTRLQDELPKNQYDESTSDISIFVSDMARRIGLDWSPMKVDYVIDQYSGGIGDFVLPMTTPEATSGSDSVGGQIASVFTDKFTANTTFDSKYAGEFYTKLDELKMMAKDPSATENDILMSKYMDSVNSELSQLYAEKREVQGSDLIESEKYREVARIQEEINSLSKSALENYQNVNADSNYSVIGDKVFYKTEKGEWKKPTDAQIEKQNEAMDMLGITANDYWSDTDQYNYALQYPESYTVGTAIDSFENFRSYRDTINDIKGSNRKSEIISYVNGLDLSIPQKAMLIKTEYKTFRAYDGDIYDYVNGLDLSSSQKEMIYKKLGL